MEQTRKIILASGSPRRKELLEKIGLAFTVEASNFPEEIQPSVQVNGEQGIFMQPEALVKSISIGKAAAVAKKYRDAIIIAADTVGIIKDRIIGKPHTAEEAKKMLQSLSGKSHLVITAFTILDSSTNKMVTRMIETRVYFKILSQDEIENYVKTGEPLDKAGAYAIQGLGAVFIEKIEGDYYNVMGLPLYALSESLKDFGVRIL
jgi:septum formation protein